MTTIEDCENPVAHRDISKSTRNPFLGRPPKNVAYQTRYGRMYVGDAERTLRSSALKNMQGRVNLVFTSPPFPLNRKKRYGNEVGQAYIEWLAKFGPLLKGMLAKDGSIVMEMGNSWQPGEPVMSTLALRALLEFQERNDLYLCQEFIWHNPARLPSPAQWVNVERIRVKDSFTKLWWLSPTPKPKATNVSVLQEYSDAMKGLLKRGHYNSGVRPSEHAIGEKSFLKNHGGAIPSNVLIYSNTKAQDQYQRYCRSKGITPHPARMPTRLAEFFIKFLTDSNDVVLDPFAGSNTTGWAAENLGRYWIGIEASEQYVEGSRGRFDDNV